MELQLLFKSAKAFVFTKNERPAAEQEDFLRLDCLERLGKVLGNFEFEAKVPLELGRSEKFCRKSGLDAALDQLGMRENRSGGKTERKEMTKVELGHNPLSVGHIFHKKVINAHSPGVVRLKQKESPPKAVLSGNLRSSKTPQPSQSPARPKPNPPKPDVSFQSLPSRSISPLQKFSITSRGTKACESSRIMKPSESSSNFKSLASLSTTSIKPKISNQILRPSPSPNPNPNLSPNPNPTPNSQANPIKSFTGSLQSTHFEGFCEIEYINGDWFKGFMKKGKKSGQGKFYYNKIQAAYKGEFLEDLPHGAGKLKLASGEYLKGSFREGKIADGLAVMRLKDKAIYEGKLVGGKRTGEARVADGNFEFVGNWADDRRTGPGFLWNEDFLFEGFFRGDSTDGPGVLLIKQGNYDVGLGNSLRKSRIKSNDLLKEPLIVDLLRSYKHIKLPEILIDYLVFISIPGKVLEKFIHKIGPDGKFLAGKLCGSGVAQYGSFGTYIGCFKEGRRSGFGKMHYTDPSGHYNLGEKEGEYQGQFQDNLRHGQGQMTWPGGLTYKGLYNRDHRNQVQGQLIFKSGDVYEGTWINDKLEGLCRLIKPNMTVLAQFINGHMSSNATIQYKDGRVYTGTVANLSPHGHGQLKWPSGKTFKGDFCDGVFDGAGRMSFANGDVYEGLWENGKRAGKGKMIYINGTVYDGYWLNDCRAGDGVLKDVSTGDVICEGFWNQDYFVN